MFPYALLDLKISISYEIQSVDQNKRITVVSASSVGGGSLTMTLPEGTIVEKGPFDENEITKIHGFIMASSDEIQYLASFMESQEEEAI